MACLDTNILLDLAGRAGQRQRLVTQAFLDGLVAQGRELVTTIFCVAELWVGVERAEDSEHEEEAVQRILAGLRVLPFEDAAARLFARITAHLLRIGEPAGDMDVLIAAVTMMDQRALVTRNARHFRNIPGLTVLVCPSAHGRGGE